MTALANGGNWPGAARCNRHTPPKTAEPAIGSMRPINGQLDFRLAATLLYIRMRLSADQLAIFATMTPVELCSHHLNANDCSSNRNTAITIIAAPDTWLTIRATFGRVRSTIFDPTPTRL